MGKFCTGCGNEIKEEEKFCNMCGLPALKGNKTEVSDNMAVQGSKDQTKKNDGSKVNRAVKKKNKDLAQVSIQQLSDVPAAAYTGEAALPVELYLMPLKDYNVFKVLFTGIGKLIAGFRRTIKEKKRWIPAVILAALWIMLMILPVIGINTTAVKALSWFTFASGGLTGGMENKVFGIIGKGLFAAVFTVFIVDKGIFRKLKVGLFAITGSLKGGKASNASLFFGLAFAFLLYNLIVAETSLQNSMAGIACFILSLRALSNRGGFLRTLFTSFLSKKKRADTSGVSRFMSGWTLGFALCLPASAIPFTLSGYALGAAAFIAGIIIAVVSRGKGGSK